MKAAILREFGQPVVLTEVPDPTPGPGQVLIQVEACGVCHSDVHMADGDFETLKPIMKMPLVLGHEIVGKVIKTGDGVSTPRIGDRVGVPWLYWSCGECEPCKEGREVLCNKQQITGCTVDGGYAEFLVAPATHATPIPAGLDPAEVAPMLCAGLTVYRAMKQGGVTAGQRLAVVGVGGLGHLAIQMAKAMGVWVCGIDVQDSKLELAKECGADLVLNSAAGPIHKEIRKLGGMHVVLVCSGSKSAYEASLRYLRKGGTLVMAGIPAEPISVPVMQMIGLEARIVASSVGTREDLREMLDLIARNPKIKSRIETRPLAGAQEAMEQLRKGEPIGRLVLQP